MQNRLANTQQRQDILNWIQILLLLIFGVGNMEFLSTLPYGGPGTPPGDRVHLHGCLQGCLQVGPESCPGARTINIHERLIGKPPPVERSSRAIFPRHLCPHLWGRTFAFDPCLRTWGQARGRDLRIFFGVSHPH